MSEYVFKLPDLGEGTVESEIGEWFIKVGDEVAEEDLLGTMMTDKAAVELSSPVTGKVVQLAGEPGDLVAVGAALVVFDTADSGAVDVTTVGATSAATEPVEVAAVGATAVGATSVAIPYLFVSQFPPQNFPNIGFRQIVPEFNLLRYFVAGQVVPAMSQNFVFGNGRVALNHE